MREDFSVVEPTNYVAPSITNLWYNYGQNIAGAGMTINLFITPTNVSFYNVEIMEIARASDDADRVYQLNFHFFPVSRIGNGQGKS